MSNILDVPAYAADGRWDDVLAALDAEQLSQLTQNDRSNLLCILCYYGHAESVSRVLEVGAEANFRNIQGSIAYASSASPGSTPLGETILGSAERQHPTLEVMQMLLRQGADPNLITSSGYTPLQLAIVNDRPEYAGLLLLHGADPYLQSADQDDSDAFYFAKDVPWAREMLERWVRGHPKVESLRNT